MENPNLKKIAKVFGFLNDGKFIDFKSDIFDEWNPDINELVFKSKMLSEGRISYPENPQVEALIKKNSLQAMLSDFSLMGFYFTEWKKDEKNHIEEGIKYKGLDLELFQALRLLYKYDSGLSFNIIRKQKIQASIKNPELIQFISVVLFKYLIENDFDLQTGNPWPKDITDWGEYLDFRLKVQKIRENKRGRTRGSFLKKKIVNILWEYLQEFTEIKAGEGFHYSNKQAKFIFDFLEIYGLIDIPPEGISNKEDVIAYYLKTYRTDKKKPSRKGNI